jgi:hypothetical protein
MGLKCLFGHRWEKLGGCENVGSGNFLQKYICKKCRKIKKVMK